MISVLNNVTAMNATNQLKMTARNKTKAMEKLSSGYKINRAADDAAGLAVSEKMRLIKRSLDQGTQNGTDGISWCQIGDGALNEAHEILQRMNELAIKSMNETNSESDRSYMEMEFKDLKKELNRIGKATTFNEYQVFDEYQKPNYRLYGGPSWESGQMHVVTEGANDLTFKLGTSPNFQQISLKVPAGEYTTEELLQEIDLALFDLTEDLFIEYDKDGHCNAILQGNGEIGAVTGDLSYLFYQSYRGGTFGALIGTTIFSSDDIKLEVVGGKNDYMSFTIEDFGGNKEEMDLKLDPGSYTRPQLIELLNEKLKDTPIRASTYGTGIKLGSEEAMVTGFKGNMFKIDNRDEIGPDGKPKIYNSVFYDNVQYGTVTKYPAVFTGAPVLPTHPKDVEHGKFIIDGGNNTLTLQPNGREDSVTLTIGEGETYPKEYTIEEMKEELNKLFAANGLELEASVYSRSVSGAYPYSRDNYYFGGLRITSKVKGLESEMKFDTASSAYKTLFETRQYNRYGTLAVLDNETTANSEAYFIGARNVSSVNLDSTNNQFRVMVNVNDNDNNRTVTKYCDLTLPTGRFNLSQLQAQLENSDLKGLLTVAVNGNGALELRGAAGKEVNSVQVYEINGKTGRDALFVKHESYETNSTSSYRTSIGLETELPPAKDTDVTIRLSNGSTATVSLKKGESAEDVKKKIEGAFPTSRPITFYTVSSKGTDGGGNAKNDAEGATIQGSPWSSSAMGSSQQNEGQPGYKDNKPASLIIGPELKSEMVLNDSNNKISLTMRDGHGSNVTQELVLTAGRKYTPDELVNELQKEIDNKFGTGLGGATVKREGNSLVITSRLPDPVNDNGGNTYISCSTNTSSFLKDLNTTKTPAEWRSSTALKSGITIDDSNREFKFQYKGEEVTLTLDKGTYGTPQSMVSQIQKQLDKNDKVKGMTASLLGGKLALTSGEAGSGVSIKFTHNGGGSAANALFGQPQATPADVVVNKQIQNSITISPDTSQFSIVVNNKRETVTLDTGTYNRESFKNMLNQKLSAKGVQAYLTDDGKLGYRTTSTGSGAYLSMDYNNGGSSMKQIYGTTPSPGIKVTVNGKKATLSSTTYFMVTQPTVQDRVTSPSYYTGYHSQKKSSLDGQNLQGPVMIDKWNNDLKFTFWDGGSSKEVTVEVPEKDGGYSFDELKDYLQGAVNAQAGENKINVSVNGSGVRLEAASAGNQYRFYSPSGDFYDKVMCQCNEVSAADAGVEQKGRQVENQPFVVGRQDVKNGVTTIKQGLSDEFSLDLTYRDDPADAEAAAHTVSVTLDPGDYTGEQLVSQLQQKFDRALGDMGLKPGLIKVGLGDKSTGVAGANDQNALSFSLAEDVSAPAEGQIIIDGAKGNAAFKIFYKTDGEMIPSHIIGTKNIANGATIGPKDTDFSLKVDDVPYTIHIPQGVYTTEEILSTVNQLFTDGGVPVAATQEGDYMMLSHRHMGNHSIEEITGGAKDNIFFREEREEAEKPKEIWLSNEHNDRIELPQESLSTQDLRLHTSSIAKTRLAEAAVNRIGGAIGRVSVKRSDFGSVQNRLEHALNNNANKAENTASAESLIRDTDVAREMVYLANLSIVEQAEDAMLAQSVKANETVLAML